MTIKFIICMTKDCLVGDTTPVSKNGMSWYSKEELQYFKQITVGHTLVFGLNTSKLVPLNTLKKDRNIEVLSPDNDWYDIVNKYKDTDETLFICGGYSVYKWFIEETLAHNFEYPFNVSEIYVSILKDHVEIQPLISPLYLYEINSLTSALPYQTRKGVDFDGYIFSRENK